jgi:adenine-specific DNA-methyltransferase
MQQVATLTSRKQFGLVFQEHSPESVRLPQQRVRTGDKVELRESKESATFHVISTKASLDVATVVELDDSGETVDEPQDMLKTDLVVIKPFGDPVYPGLRQVGEAGSAKPGQPTHVVINGENFHALQALEYTHSRKVDVIYIDPPYNTGNDSWKYNDRYIEDSDSYRHSKWLSFMEKRLKIAKALLKDTGVIFMSIDDSEQHRLRMLADQVFGENNFVDTIMVEMSATQGMKVAAAKRGTMVKNGEFIHVYRKSDKFETVVHTPLYDGVEGYDTHYSIWINDDCTFEPLSQRLIREDAIRDDMIRLGLLTNSGKFSFNNIDKLLVFSDAARKFIVGNTDKIAQTHLTSGVDLSLATFDWEPGKFYEYATSQRSYLLTKSSTGSVRQLIRMAENYRTSDDYKPRLGRTVIRGDYWKGFFLDMGNISKEGGIEFLNGKKPIRLMKQLIRWANNSPDAVIVDFFGGSGSTAHAVIDMNREDGGSRQCVLVTNNELSKTDDADLRKKGFRPGDAEYEAKGVFHAVTMPRIKTVLTGLRPDNTRYSDGIEGQPAAFFDLTYEDENLVSLGNKFESIAPLLWIQSGATGELIAKRSDLTKGEDGYSVPEDGNYAVIFDTEAAADAISMLHDGIKKVFIVTDSENDFKAVTANLPGALRNNAQRLYSSYLRSFEINR